MVADTLRSEVAKARARQSIPVFTPGFLQHAQQHPAQAAAEAGVEPVVLKRLAAGEQDTIVASCTDYLGGPHAEAGQPCPASFLTCLSCRNARALPHQLPVQIAVRDHLATLRPNLDPPVWRTRWQSLLDLLEDIIVHYTPAEQDQARREVTPRQRRLAADLLAGTWDLR